MTPGAPAPTPLPGIDDALARLRRGDPARTARALRQALRQCTAAQPAPVEPLRTLHHFACTGGTLIARAIAALPNVQLLSEVDPLSSWEPPGANGFAPTDMVTLLRHSTRGAPPALLAELFDAQMRVLHRDAVRRGLRLVVRDHAHSHYCQGGSVPERPSLRQLMPAGIPLLSLLTVRHPLDSLASLGARGWLHFEPRSVDAYCRRQLAFLDAHAGVPVLRYEDFVAAPERLMQRVCETLDLRYEAHFAQHFGRCRVSGDSGRSGAAIAARPSLPQALALQAEAARSDAYRTLVGRLGYGLSAGSVAG